MAACGSHSFITNKVPDFVLSYFCFRYAAAGSSELLRRPSLEIGGGSRRRCHFANKVCSMLSFLNPTSLLGTAPGGGDVTVNLVARETEELSADSLHHNILDFEVAASILMEALKFPLVLVAWNTNVSEILDSEKVVANLIQKILNYLLKLIEKVITSIIKGALNHLHKLIEKVVAIIKKALNYLLKLIEKVVATIILGALCYLLILIVLKVRVNGSVDNKKVLATIAMGALHYLLIFIFRIIAINGRVSNVKGLFLSFRGKDTRNSFIPHLYAALEKERIYTFVDHYGISVGEHIEEAIERAIKASKLSVVVFSKNFASSSWCLDELAMIMKRRRTSRHIVVPVFYHVDPSDVGKQIGTYGKAIAEHERRFKEQMDRVQEWRNALKEAAKLKGLVLKDKCEAQFIQDIVEEIRKKLNQDEEIFHQT